MAEQREISWNRQIPIRYEADVAVIGGGMAGIAAACAAARSGARVLLVEQFAVCGGNATVGGVASFCGETSGQGEVFDAILAHLEAFHAIAPYEPYPQLDGRIFDYEILAVILQEMLLERGVKLLLHTKLVDVLVEDAAITGCIVCGPSGPEAIRAAQYIDCTGEAQLAHAAGCRTMKGREQDGLPMAMSMMFFVRHIDRARMNEPAERFVTSQRTVQRMFDYAAEQVPENRWFERLRQWDDLPMITIWPNGPRSSAVKVKIPMFDATDTESLTAAEIKGRRRMMEILDFLQREEGAPWLLDHCSPTIAIREGRRVVGDYVLTLDDVLAGQAFDDAVARGTYQIDGVHEPDTDKRKSMFTGAEARAVPPYHIPLRSLIARDCANLLMAGRCLSAEQHAMSSARVIPTCAMMGQAAGIAAALSVQQGRNLRELDAKAVQKIVLERGANLALDAQGLS